jgi:hypothetical protein
MNRSYNRGTMLRLLTGFTLLLAPSFTAQAESEQRCRDYAKSAINDYNQLRKFPKCSQLRAQDTVRWHSQSDRHFNWCRTAQSAWLTDETRQRDQLLLKCGARSTL